MSTVLVVEDSKLMQAYYSQIFRGMPGFEVSYARNGQEALDHIEGQGAPDLVVLDINMPVMDGLEFLHRLKGSRLALPAQVLIVSTEGKQDDLMRGMEAGATAYLTKPFRPEQLADVVMGLAARSTSQAGVRR
jgi:two-component system chemotaxis response regulator CheY